MSSIRFGMVTALVALLFLGSQTFQPALCYAGGQQGSESQNDTKLQLDVQKALKNSKFKAVQISVHNGVADLGGEVPDYADKEEADKRVHRVKHLSAVRNDIQVAGGIPDQQLQHNIVEKLQYDRVGYGNAFNSISVSVQKGVVTLSGHALGPVAEDSAVSLASHMPGVQDVVDDIRVDPVSPMDFRIRMQVYRKVYGFPTLNKYALNPAQPIRITVVNGHVILTGVVDNQVDKNVAGVQANSVPGVFGVTNDLQVANPSGEGK